MATEKQLNDLGYTARNHIVDPLGVKSVALDEGLESSGQEFGWMDPSGSPPGLPLPDGARTTSTMTADFSLPP